VEIRWVDVRQIDEVLAAPHLFDEPPTAEWAERFLTWPGHHLAMGYLDDVAVGFVSGVEMTHPDKGTEMFLYELAVDESSRGRGVGRALVEALAARARELGCYGMWVLTDADNAAAFRTYERAGGKRSDGQVMFDWTFGEDEELTRE